MGYTRIGLKKSSADHLLARRPLRTFFLSPASFARIGSRASGGSLPFSMSVSFNYARLALFFLRGIMTHILGTFKRNVDRAPKRPEFRAF
jgi:hypothetical protein